MWHFSRPKPLAGKQGRSSPTTKDPKQTKYRLSPNRSDGLLHVTLTAKQNIQEHQKKMRVIEVRLDIMELKMLSNFNLVCFVVFWVLFCFVFLCVFLSRLVILFSLMFFGNILNKYTLFIYLFCSVTLYVLSITVFLNISEAKLTREGLLASLQ